MKQRLSRLIALMIVVMMTFALVACGQSQEGSIDETAALRGIDEGAGQIFIDDEAIALAGEAESSSSLVSAATTALALTNTERTNAGLAALEWSEGLASAAYVRAQEIVKSFSHTRPDGSDWWTVNSQLQYGENLAKLYNSPESMVTAWMNSPTHKANIMDGGFKTCGIAIYVAEDGGWRTAQEFGY